MGVGLAVAPTSGNADNERERLALSRSSRSLPLVPGALARLRLARMPLIDASGAIKEEFCM
jgi:hypothetical protein